MEKNLASPVQREEEGLDVFDGGRANGAEGPDAQPRHAEDVTMEDILDLDEEVTSCWGISPFANFGCPV